MNRIDDGQLEALAKGFKDNAYGQYLSHHLSPYLIQSCDDPRDRVVTELRINGQAKHLKSSALAHVET